jgi:hypothetical protein
MPLGDGTVHSPASRGMLRAGLLVSALFLAGCRNCDLVEAELRSRDNELRELRAELDHMGAQRDALERQFGAAHLEGGPHLPPEAAAQVYSLKSIALGRSTGGLNDDKDPGDEALQVLVEPRDSDNHTVKAPGTLTVLAFEVSPEGVKKPLSSWRIPPDQLRRTWRSGLLTTGYSVVLPWKAYPSSEKMRVVAQLVLPDGRLFEADKDVTVHLVPVAFQKGGPRPCPLEVDEPPPGEVPLPMPRPVIPARTGAAQPPNRATILQAVHLLDPIRTN